MKTKLQILLIALLLTGISCHKDTTDDPKECEVLNLTTTLVGDWKIEDSGVYYEFRKLVYFGSLNGDISGLYYYICPKLVACQSFD